MPSETKTYAPIQQTRTEGLNAGYSPWAELALILKRITISVPLQQNTHWQFA